MIDEYGGALSPGDTYRKTHARTLEIAKTHRPIPTHLEHPGRQPLGNVHRLTQQIRDKILHAHWAKVHGMPWACHN